MEMKINILRSCRLLETREAIKEFESSLQAITLSKDTSHIEDLCLVLDDDTNQHEVMFNVIHSIEYLYKDREVEGLQCLALSIPQMLENADEWLEIIHYRILNSPKTRLAYAKALQNVPTGTKDLVVKCLMDIKEEDEEMFGDKVSEILTSI